MKKWLFYIGIILCLGVGGMAGLQIMKKDRQIPEISITGDCVYRDGMSEEEMLQGVTAWDDQDGDVSASLIVETVTLNNAEHTAVIHYAARDKENNISKATRSVEYISSEEADPLEEETEKESISNAEASEKRAEVGLGVRLGSEAENSSGVQEQSEQEELSEAETEMETEPVSESEEMQPGQPVLRLLKLSTTIKVGEPFDPLSYIETIEDDYDNIYDLWRNIQVEGEYDTEIPGNYELTIYVVDTAGNMSNRAKFLLKVVEE